VLIHFTMLFHRLDSNVAWIGHGHFPILIRAVLKFLLRGAFCLQVRDQLEVQLCYALYTPMRWEARAMALTLIISSVGTPR
jgi:hypothetical protein